MSDASRSAASPGAWLGLLGGGQLGRMFAMAAQSLGYRVLVLDPDSDGPAASVADRHIAADYLDRDALEILSAECVGVTTEFENVPAEALRFLGERGRVSPGAASVAIAQDRSAEKRFIASAGIAVAPHAVIESQDDLESVDAHLLPGVLKAARLGYDGKGQARVASLDEARAAFVALGSVPCVLEKRLDLACELSVIVVRDFTGACASFPVAQNIHRHGILAVSITPVDATLEALAEKARAAALHLARTLDYRGVLCVEFFVLGDDTLLVNEMAPRPHNSGHYTIDACVTSQFAQQARVLADLPLGSTRQQSPAVMLNLLGDLWYADLDSNELREPDWSAALAVEGACLHLYGKRQARRGRKMGHITIVAEQAALAQSRALEVARVLGIDPW